MKRLTSPSILVQVALLVALAMGLSQALTAAAILLMPEPRPSGFDLAAASAALKGEPARAADDRPLTRRITDQPVADENTAGDPMALALSLALARVLEVEPGDVRVRVFRPTDRPDPRMSEGSPTSYVFTRPPAGPEASKDAPTITWTEKHTIERATPPTPGSPATGSATITVDRDTQQVFVVADQLTFAPFAASLRLEDGRWVPTFPNARYLFARREYEHWEEMAAMYDENITVETLVSPVRGTVEGGQLKSVTFHRNMLGDPVPGHTKPPISEIPNSEYRIKKISYEILKN